MTDKQRKICEDLGWEVFETEDDIELRQFSPLGEDFVFSVGLDNFIGDLRNYYDDFDPEDHAAMWYNARNVVKDVPRSLHALLKDADTIEEMLEKLATALENVEDD